MESTGKENNMRKIYLLDDEDCTPCEEVKKELEEEIESGRLRSYRLPRKKPCSSWRRLAPAIR